MNKNKRNSKRLERFAQIKGWETSGLSKQAYSKQIGLPNNTFTYWQKQYLSQFSDETLEARQTEGEQGLNQKEVKEGAFIPLPLKGLEQAPRLSIPSELGVPDKPPSFIGDFQQVGSPSYELLFPNGIIVKIKGELSLSLLKNLKDA